MWTRGKTYHISRFDLALNLTLWWRNVYLNSIEWKGLEFRSLNTDRFNDLGRILKYSPNSIYMLLISTDSKNLPSHALWPGRVFIISQQDARPNLARQPGHMWLRNLCPNHLAHQIRQEVAWRPDESASSCYVCSGRCVLPGFYSDGYLPNLIWTGPITTSYLIWDGFDTKTSLTSLDQFTHFSTAQCSVTHFVAWTG